MPVSRIRLLQRSYAVDSVSRIPQEDFEESLRRAGVSGAGAKKTPKGSLCTHNAIIAGDDGNKECQIHFPGRCP